MNIDIPVEDLKSMGRKLKEQLEKVKFIPGTPYYEEVQEDLDRCLDLLNSKIAFELAQNLESPFIAVLMGGTNVGKSTVFNLLARDKVAQPDETAAATRFPAIYLAESKKDLLDHPGFLAQFNKRKLEDREALNRDSREVNAYYHLHDNPSLDQIILIDSPDMNSVVLQNAVLAESILRMADGVIFVKTDQRYLDQEPLEFLQKSFGLDREVAIILNKVENRGDFETLWEDLRRVLREKWEVDLPESAGHPLFFAYDKSDIDPGEIPSEIAPLVEGMLSGKNHIERKKAVLLGTFGELVRSSGRLMKRYGEEVEALEKINQRIFDIIEQKTKEFNHYADELTEKEFYELEEAITKVLGKYKIPVVDDLVDRAKVIFTGVWSSLTKKSDSKVEQSKLDRRKDDTLQEVSRILSDIGREVNEYLRVEKQNSPLVEQVYKDLRSFSEVDSEKLRENFLATYHDVEKFTGRIKEHIEEWLEDHPHKEKWIKIMQYSVRGGAGVALALVTGGIGALDALLAPLGVAGSRLFVEQITPPSFFQHFRDELEEKHQALFSELLEKNYLAPMQKSLPLTEKAGEDLEKTRSLLDRLATASGVQSK